MKNFLFTGFIILLLSAVSCKTTEKGSMTQTQTPTSQTNEKKNISINREELNGTWIIKTAKGKTVIGDFFYSILLLSHIINRTLNQGIKIT